MLRGILIHFTADRPVLSRALSSVWVIGLKVLDERGSRKESETISNGCQIAAATSLGSREIHHSR